MATGLAELYADVPAEVPVALRGQPLDVDSIDAWPDRDVCTVWFRAYRQHADRLALDWPLICSENADAVEAHRIAVEQEYGKRPGKYVA